MTGKRTVGERITELCKTHSLDRKELVRRSGLDGELVRRIVEEDHIPDLAPLIKISRALGVRLGSLMDDREEGGPVITRRGEAEEAARFITGLPDKGRRDHQGLSFRTLAADKGGRHLEPFLVDIQPGSDQPKSAHEGEEFIYVLSGAIEVSYGLDTHLVREGDSIYYDSIVPHRVTASGGMAKILAVLWTPV
ncbi:MAG: cupin domain-containing protein [Spirochaetales bacterium]|jgi:quercetin dioxygenase-like cupin family protein|nr:cupin domain-containing protein [Spirochaetales bacterium]